MLLARGFHGGHGGHGNPSWWGLAIGILGVVITIFLVRRARRRASRFGQDYGGSYPQSGTAPGWYPDQNDMTLMRYFDGQSWTSQTRPRE